MFIVKRSFAALLTVALLAAALPSYAQSQRNPLPLPDVGGFRTLKADLHLHTVFSDGLVWPDVRVVEAFQQGLDVIALTDHDDYHPWRDDVSDDIARPYGLAKPLADQLGIILIPGVEITKDDWHFNALFIKDFNATKGLDKKEALTVAKRQGAYVFWNHPGWKQPEQWFPEIAPLWAAGLFSGVELVNGRRVYAGIYEDIVSKGLAILSNSDAHTPITGDQIDGRPMTLLFARTADPAGVRDALEHRRTAAWMGGSVWGAEEHLSGLWSGAVTVETPRISVTAGGAGVVRLTNSSALAFEIADAKGLPWLSVRPLRLPAQSGVTLAVSAGQDAPVGSHSVEVGLEIRNFYTGPGRALTVTVPLQITVSAPPR